MIEDNKKLEPSVPIVSGRQSIRFFTEEEIPITTLKQLCYAGMTAPSSRKLSPWEFIIIKDKEVKKELSGFRDHWIQMDRANAVIVVLGLDKSQDKYAEMHAAAACQNIMVEAYLKGIGSCWQACYPTMEIVEKVQEALNIPKDKIPYMLISLGYEELGAKEPFPHGYQKDKISYDAYGKQ